jgi:glycine/D-amino acid oxidase-like deaminating enzyme
MKLGLPRLLESLFRPICKDDLPVIGPVPECPRLLIACGHGRTGVRAKMPVPEK